MKTKAFNLFCEEVQTARTYAPVWRFAEYWDGMSAKQSEAMAEILDKKSEVNKLYRNGVIVYQLPTGREWTKE